MKAVILALSLLSCGCGTLLAGAGQSTATGAVNGITSDASKQKIDSLVTDATKAARDEALGPNTNAQLQTLVSNSDTALQKLLTDTDARVQAMITNAGVNARGQLDTAISNKVQERLQQTIRLTIDEALGSATLQEADALREELVGAPLQKDVDALIDSAAPHLNQVVQQAVTQAVQSSITPIKTTADAEAAKWEPIAIGFAVGTALLILCIVILVHVLRSHKQVIDTLMKERQRA
jgi:hypothetical protein